ncbi:SUKH-4 family immunity protein [Streptomyces sp. NPDC057743]|uniref:SUKH-4 family immunity protein n=1 Tax=Streptomyces sp. NPDC057743 TaxID=3346236 RepID=UPI00368DF1E0
MTFAQAQERAEQWVNGEVPPAFHREVRVREFALGFVAWAEDREGGPVGEGGRSRLVIARDSGETTLWPGLPVGEVIRRYEEEYGAPADGGYAAAEPPQRIDLEATSFLLTPPEWLQEAADAMGIGGRKSGTFGGSSGVGGGSGSASGSGSESAGSGSGSGSAAGAEADVESGSAPGSGYGFGVGAEYVNASAGGSGDGDSPDSGGSGGSSEVSPGASSGERAGSGPAPEAVPGPAAADAWADVSVNAGPDAAHATPPPASPSTSPSSSGDDAPWAAADTTAGGDGEGLSVAPPQTVFAPPLAGSDDEDTPSTPRVRPDAKTELMRGGSQLPRTKIESGPPPRDGGASGGAGAAATSGLPPAPPMPPAPPSMPPAPPAPPAPSVAPANLRDLPPPTGAPVADVPPPPDAVPPPLGAQAEASASPGAQQPNARPGEGPASGPAADSASPGPAAAGAPAGGYVPTQLVSQLDAAELDLSAVDGPGEGSAGGSGEGSGQASGEGSDRGAEQGAGGAAGSGGGGVHAAATMLADGAALQAPMPGPGDGTGVPGGAGGPGVPPPPPPPGPIGGPGPMGASGASGQSGASGHAGPSAGGQGGPGGPPPPPPAPPAPSNGGAGADGGVHAAATMLASGAALSGGPGGPQGAGQGGPGMPPAAGQGGPGTPSAAGPGMPPAPPMAPPAQPGPPPGPPGAPGPGVPGTGAQGAAPGAYGYPQPPSGQPTVGPGYMAVLSYRAPDGSEQKIVRRSAPGTPHPEWQLLHELRAMNVPPQQVVELHTELECCDLPGGYCARMVRESWPQVRISHTAAYGTDHASRQQGVRHLVEHQGELHQVADGPARPAPVRVPLPHPSQVQPVPPVPPQAIGHELEQSFGPQGIFRFDQRAVSRQGVPEVVAHTLVWAGLPVDFGPFFWAQAQPGRPVPTLAELAAERRVQPAPDAGSYLVMGNDFGRQLCVQYGTANIVAVPLEAGPGGQSVAPQFVNTGLPEFVRCLAMLGRMWRLRYGLTPEQAGRWTVDFQAQLVALDPPALGSPETWWSVLLEQMWDGLL